MQEQARSIAAAYCGILGEWLNHEQMDAVRSGEAWPDDYCDGNMAMAAAFEKLGVPLWDDAADHMREDSLGLWNSAYDIARKSNWSLAA